MNYVAEQRFMIGDLRPTTCEWDCHLPEEKCQSVVIPGKSYCSEHFVKIYRITTAELADKEAIAAMKRIAKITQSEYVIEEEDDEYDSEDTK